MGLAMVLVLVGIMVRQGRGDEPTAVGSAATTAGAPPEYRDDLQFTVAAANTLLDGLAGIDLTAPLPETTAQLDIGVSTSQSDSSAQEGLLRPPRYPGGCPPR